MFDAIERREFANAPTADERGRRVKTLTELLALAKPSKVDGRTSVYRSNVVGGNADRTPKERALAPGHASSVPMDRN